MSYKCTLCMKQYPLDTQRYNCECGGLFDYIEPNNKIEYINIGEVTTPIVDFFYNNFNFKLKLDYYSPSGSFKDRGARELISHFKSIGVTEVYEDSSGNAGAAIAAYCAAANIKCNIYVPDSTSQNKIKQIMNYGANIVKIEGSRDNTQRMILNDLNDDFYASHVYNPLFFEGVSKIAYEIHEQVGKIEYIVAPIGNGTMALGLYYGYKKLGYFPKFIFVQTKNCAPIHDKYHNLRPSKRSETIGEGIAVGTPLRIDQIIEAVKASNGDIIVVDEDMIKSTLSILHENGIYCEPTSAVAVAGALEYFKDRQYTSVLIPMTGNGLKK